MADFLTENAKELDGIAVQLESLFQKKDAATGDYAWTTEDFESHKALERQAKDLRQKRENHLALAGSEGEVKGLRNEIKQVNRPMVFQGGVGEFKDIMDGLLKAREPQPQVPASASLARAVLDHPDFKGFRPGRPVALTLEGFDFTSVATEAKTVMTTAAGFPPENRRGGVNVPFANRRPMVGDLIPQDNIGPANAVVYMEQTTWTSNAAPVAEGAAKPESAFAWTQRSVTVEVIATTLPVTDQQLEDVPTIEAIIRDDLILAVLLAEEDQLLNGNGTSPQLQGFLTKTGVQTQAAGSDPTPDAILKASTLVSVGGRATPSGIVMHPNNYVSMRLLRVTDGGGYLFGNPAGPADTTIWGMMPVVTDAITANTALIGDFRAYSHISRRKVVIVEVGYVNDDFKRNQKTMRAEERLSLEIKRPAAFAKITGLSAT